ncbi:hypothetical protein NOCARDAX2BIS_540010 [Nocardioides sp. AX2bis]|nr:hypothetical protein NOCARDAX2BIS_540010 [Nocardioides sp. AX2bis]
MHRLPGAQRKCATNSQQRPRVAANTRLVLPSTCRPATPRPCGPMVTAPNLLERDHRAPPRHQLRCCVVVTPQTPVVDQGPRKLAAASSGAPPDPRRDRSFGLSRSPVHRPGALIVMPLARGRQV